jgi:hypothetical protein
MRSLRKYLIILGLAFVAGTFAAGQKVGSALLGADDFTDFPQLQEKLRSKPDAVSQFLAGQLSSDAQQLLARPDLAARYPPDTLLNLLTAEINRLLQGPSLYDAQRFAGVTISAETEQLLRENPTGEQLVRLNRWLLEDAYPQAIRNTKLILPKSPATPPLTPDPTPTPPRRIAPNAPPPTPTPPPAPVVTDPRPFYGALQRFSVTLPEDCADEVGQRIVIEYGAVFVAQGVTPPARCVFANETEVREFQGQANLTKTTRWNGVQITLQSRAFDFLGAAINEGRQIGVRITPRGPDAARRNFTATVTFWRSRLLPGLAHWTRRGKLSPQEAARIRALPVREQVAEVLRLESQGLYFSKDLSKSILYSVAAPGSSQHIAMVALDINEFRNPRARALLAKYGWFQTVKSDAPHFTFIGAREEDLPALGLRAEVVNGQKFWTPDTNAPENR